MLRLLLAALVGAPACVGDDTGGSATDAGASSASGDPSTGGGATATASGGTSSGTSGVGPASDPSSSGDASTGGGDALECGSLPLCDDFEGAAAGGPPDPGRWSVVSPNCSGAGALAIDDAVAHSGGRSLRVDGAGGYCDHVFIANDAAIAAINGTGAAVYGRLFVRFAAPLGQGHVTFMTLRDDADGGRDLRMGGQSEILMWNRESDDATLPVLSPAGIAQSLAPAAGAWVCVEFMIDGDAGELITWVDGAEVPGLHVDADPTPDVDQQWHQKPMWRPSLGDFKVGWESYAGQSMTLWIDDVALAGARIGCG